MQKQLLVLCVLPATLLAFCVLPAPLLAQSRLTPMASRIFKSVKTRLGIDDKNAVAAGIGKTASATEVDVYPLDLNTDGTEEVFVALTNPAIYGNAGGQTILFAKDAGGIYRKVQALPSVAILILPAFVGQYPDLLLGGPGLSTPEWKWNGHAYAFLKQVASIDNLKTQALEEASKGYQDKP